MEKYILVHWPESQDYMEEEGVIPVMNDKELNNSNYLVPVKLYREFRTKVCLHDLVTRTLTEMGTVDTEESIVDEIVHNIGIIWSV